MEGQEHGSPGLGSRLSAPTLLALAAVPLLLVALRRLLFPTFDPREPPVLQPKVPFIGHILSLVRESTGYYARLHKSRPTPICTLPMLNGKVYIIYSPGLISAAMRNKDISFDPFVLEFAESVVGLSKRQVELVGAPDAIDRVVTLMHAALASTSLSKMVGNGLLEVKAVLNSVDAGPALHIPDISIWLGNAMAQAAMRGLYGRNSPLDDEALQDLWDFDQNFSMLVLGVAPDLVAPKAVQARRRLHARLSKFYQEHLDKGDDVSALIQNRALLHREFGFTDAELGVTEFSIPWAATTNTPLSLIWLFTSVFSRSDLVERIRPEVEAITVVTAAQTGKTATMDVNKFDKHCPTLMACYREALRLYNDNTGNRKVVKDTVIQDPDGREYLLKKGTAVQWIAGVTHLDESIWGEDARSFNPDRWIQATAQDEKRRRPAHIPFGGGRNLCPGRKFALAEQLALVGAVALGFEVEGVQVPRIVKTPLGNATRPASWEGLDPSVKIWRRTGWEDVTWDFIC